MNIGCKMEEISKANKKVAEIYGGIGAAGMFEIFESFESFFAKCVQPCFALEKMMQTNFKQYYRYYSHELTAIEELVAEYENSKINYQNIEKRVFEKKQLLFEEKQLDKWEIGEDCGYKVDELLKNKEIAFKAMIPSETKEIEINKTLFGYYNVKLKEEFQRICKKDEQEISKFFIKVGEANFNFLSKVFGNFYLGL